MIRLLFLFLLIASTGWTEESKKASDFIDFSKSVVSDNALIVDSRITADTNISYSISKEWSPGRPVVQDDGEYWKLERQPATGFVLVNGDCLAGERVGGWLCIRDKE